MNTSTWLVTAVLACSNHALAQDIPDVPLGNRLTVSVRQTVERDETTGLYRYGYAVSNGTASEQSMRSFRVATPSAGAVRDAQSPEGWSFMVSSDGAFVEWTAVGGIADGPAGDGTIPPSPFQIAPGATRSGFSFRSPFPPVSVRFHAQGYVRMPVYAENQDDVEIPDFEQSSVGGDTQGPGSPCAAAADTDGDGICDGADNCRLEQNAAQADRGGVSTSSDPQGIRPDGVGDACQCGDADGDGRVDVADADVLEACFARRAPCGPGGVWALPGGYVKCGIGGAPGCDAAEVELIRQAVRAPAASLQNVCPAFTGVFE